MSMNYQVSYIAILSGLCATIVLLLSSLTNFYVYSQHPDVEAVPFDMRDDLKLQAAYTIVLMLTTTLIAIFDGEVIRRDD